MCVCVCSRGQYTHIEIPPFKMSILQLPAKQWSRRRDMEKLVAICTLCLALATSAAVPHGDRRLKHAATKLLAWTEEKGGEIFSEVLLGNRRCCVPDARCWLPFPCSRRVWVCENVRPSIPRLRVFFVFVLFFCFCFLLLLLLLLFLCVVVFVLFVCCCFLLLLFFFFASFLSGD